MVHARLVQNTSSMFKKIILLAHFILACEMLHLLEYSNLQRIGCAFLMRVINVPLEVRSTTQREHVEAINQIYAGIVAWHVLAAHHLAELIKANQNMSAVILADGVKSATTFPPHARVVILIDLWGLPPTSDYLNTFSAAFPRCVFLAVDRARNGLDVAQFLRTGFAGFITHDEALDKLGAAIRAVAEGRVWTSPEVMRIYLNLTSHRTTERGEGVATLTSRENQVLDLLRRRYSNREMAMLLRICESTVKFHVSNVLMKLNVNDRRDLADNESLYGPGLRFPSAAAV
jgi:DNA-binding NarL/FixJ family response regulator